MADHIPPTTAATTTTLSNEPHIDASDNSSHSNPTAPIPLATASIDDAAITTETVSTTIAAGQTTAGRDSTTDTCTSVLRSSVASIDAPPRTESLNRRQSAAGAQAAAVTSASTLAPSAAAQHPAPLLIMSVVASAAAAAVLPALDEPIASHAGRPMAATRHGVPVPRLEVAAPPPDDTPDEPMQTTRRTAAAINPPVSTTDTNPSAFLSTPATNSAISKRLSLPMRDDRVDRASPHLSAFDTPATDRPILRAVAEYSPQLNDEIRVGLGDLLVILRVFKDEWVLGRNETEGKTGVFPKACYDMTALSATSSIVFNSTTGHIDAGSTVDSIGIQPPIQSASMSALDDHFRRGGRWNSVKVKRPNSMVMWSPNVGGDIGRGMQLTLERSSIAPTPSGMEAFAIYHMGPDGDDAGAGGSTPGDASRHNAAIHPSKDPKASTTDIESSEKATNNLLRNALRAVGFTLRGHRAPELSLTQKWLIFGGAIVSVIVVLAVGLNIGG